MVVATGTAGAELSREGNLIVSFGGGIAPQALPRTGSAPVSVRVEARVRTADGRLPPALRRITLDINRNGRLYDRNLPVCRPEEIRSTNASAALAACGGARVGVGSVSGLVTLPEQPPFVFTGRVTAFNGRQLEGGRAILAHVYGDAPVPLTFVLPFSVERLRDRVFGTRLTATVPATTRRVVHVTRLAISLKRMYRSGGKTRSYLSAGCPAPIGFPGAFFPLVRATYGFVGGKRLSSTLVRSCRATAPDRDR